MKFSIVKTGVAIAVTALSFAPEVMARQLTVSEALSAAGAVSSSSSKLRGVSATSVKVLRTERKAELNTVYVVEPKGSGEVLFLSADDVARPLLGWTDAATFNASELPPALEYMLGCYSDEIAAASAADAAPYSEASRTALADVAPLMTTKWNQGAPYNNMCPTVNGTPTYTGCVATAMAQVMNYHKWPLRGTGSNSYEWNNGTLSMDFSTVTFDWSNMLDTNTSYNSTQASAVANLMKACGYSVLMGYGTNASGAYSGNVAKALLNYFGYSKGTFYYERTYFPLTDWIEMLYNEVASNRPVYYSGSNPTGGHAFVLDGYKSGDYFHVNWGWGGQSDGYFAITSLDPAEQGIGGSAAGYNQYQAAVMGVQKDYAGSEYVIFVYCGGNLNTDKSSYSATSSELVTVGGAETFFIGNSSYVSIGAIPGFRLTNVSTGVVSDVYAPYAETELNPGYGFSKYQMYSTSFPSTGTYYVDPIMKVNGVATKVHASQRDINRLLLTANGSTLVFEPYQPEITVTATAPTYSGDDCYVTTDITFESTVSVSGGEYFGNLRAAILNGTDTVATSSVVPVDIADGGSTLLSWTVATTNAKAGNYTVKIVDQNGTAVSPASSITLLAVPAGVPSLTLTSVSCVSDGGNGAYATPWSVPKERLILTMKLTNASGLYNGYVYSWVFPRDGGSSILYIGANSAILGPGKSKELVYDVDISSLSVGTSYLIMFQYSSSSGNQWIYDRWYITPSATAAIDGVQTDGSGVNISVDDMGTIKVNSAAGVSRVGVVSASGVEVLAYNCNAAEHNVEVDASALPAGVYVACVTTADGKVAISKFVKR